MTVLQRAVPFINAVVTVLYAWVATLYFIAGRNGYGWLWAGMTVVWMGTTALSVATYRNRRRTADIEAALYGRRRGGAS